MLCVAPNMPQPRSFFMDKQLTCPVVVGTLFNGTYTTLVSVAVGFGVHFLCLLFSSKEKAP